MLSILQSLGGFTRDSILLFILSFCLFFAATWIGKYLLGRISENMEGDDDFKVILGATLSLLALLIGFTMSMSISGFNDRQIAEQNEAITIRSAYFRADVLPEPSRTEVKNKIVMYLNGRINLYINQDQELRAELRKTATREQRELWDIVRQFAVASQTPVMASALASIDDLVSAQQKTVADWRHQIPTAAWVLLVVVALCCNLLIGYNARKVHGKMWLMFILPVMISLAFLMIAEIDAPGRGVIRVAPVNLQSLADIVVNVPL